MKIVTAQEMREIDGKAAGTTPLTLATLPPGKAVRLVFRKAGYQEAAARLDVPRPGKETKLIQPLTIEPDLARVRLTSDPPGAQVYQNGQLIPAVTTPTEVLVEATKPVSFMLAMEGKVPAVIHLSPEALPGAYTLYAGMYLLESGERVPLSENGTRLQNDAINLAQFQLP